MDTDQVQAEIDKLRKKLAALASLAAEIERDMFALQSRLAGVESTRQANVPVLKSATKTDKDVMTKAEFAARIGVSERTLERLMHDGAVKPIRIRGRVVFREQHIAHFLDKRDWNHQPRVKRR